MTSEDSKPHFAVVSRLPAPYREPLFQRVHESGRVKLTVLYQFRAREGTAWGLGFRLGRRLGGGSKVSLSTSALRRKKKSLVLRLNESRAALANYPATRDFEMLADWLDLKPKIKIGDFKFSGIGEDEEDD